FAQPDSTPLAAAQMSEELPIVTQPGRRAQPLRRFVAVDITGEFFPRERMPEVVDLYVKVFNGVDVVSTKWTPEMAQHLLEERLKRPGVAIALFDRYELNDAGKMKIVGAWFTNIVPGRDGMRMSDTDVLVVDDRQYKGIGLGKELSWLGRRRASEVSDQVFQLPVTTNEAQTYKNLTFPKDWWARSGYRFLTLYTECASDVTKRTPAQYPPDVTIRVVEKKDLPQLSDFIANANTRVSSGGRWSYDGALT